MRARLVLLMAMAAGPVFWGIAHAGDVGPPLSAADIERTIIGNKEWFIFPDGRKEAGIYNQDGSYVFRDGGGGNWRMNGNIFCDKPEGRSESCGTFHKVGEKAYQLIHSDGSTGVRIELP